MHLGVRVLSDPLALLQVLIIPKSNLLEADGGHWLQRAKIVKAYKMLDLDGEHKLAPI
eukprot:COSAG01_NODE_24340_length_782_cov_1.701318_2_plen_58_part_00